MLACLMPARPASAVGALSIDAWAELQTPGELVEGRLEEEETPTALHELVALWFAALLKTWVVPRGGVAFGAELKLVVGRKQGRKADASAYFPGRPLPGRALGATRRPPSIVVEVLSSGPSDVRRDTVDKLAEYAAFGITQYWLVDPLARTLAIRELHADGQHVTLLSAAKGRHEVSGCEGLVVDRGALWSEVDRLPESEDE